MITLYLITWTIHLIEALLIINKYFVRIFDKKLCFTSLEVGTPGLAYSIINTPDEDRIFSYADCAIIPEPTEKQLADIAYDTAINHQYLTKQIPKVAFLSFSTNSSAEHYRVSKVQKAIEIFGLKYPDILHEKCELQFDAAVCPNISKKKYSKSILKGEANVLIYPNLDAGNIAYKITQRIGKYDAIGPLLQGLKKPIHDLSRGCSVGDIIDISIISAYQGLMNADL